MNNDKRICKFVFTNGTILRVAIPYLDSNSDRLPFLSMYNVAKLRCWVGDEENGRGSLVKFEIGNIITT